MDDIILLTQTKRQFRQVRKTIFKILRNLKLTLSDRKTSMDSLLKKGFHYLGVKYEVARTPHNASACEQERTQTQVKVAVHPRTCRRALDKVKVLRNDAVHPAVIQRYLIRWATWWHHTGELGSRINLITLWIVAAGQHSKEHVWLGSGLLI